MLKLATIRLASRHLDNVVRQTILRGAGLEPGDEVLHPAWASTSDSGLYQGMVDLANTLLRRAPGSMVDGEDVVMDIFARNTNMLQAVGGYMRATPRSAVFGLHPVKLLHPPQLLWQFLVRRLRDVVTRESRPKPVVAPLPRDPVPLWDFMSWLLGSGTSLGRALEGDLRRIAGNRGLGQRLIDLIVAGKPLKAISTLSVEMGWAASGGRWVKEVFIPKVHTLLKANPAYLQAYEEWVRVEMGPS